MPPTPSSVLTIRPSSAPGCEIDLTGVLVRAVAEELWRAHGGNDVLNWMEAERFILDLAARKVSDSQPHNIEPRPSRRPARIREESHRPQPLRRDEGRVTGPLPVY